MLDLRIPIISATAGERSDGVFVGDIKRSNPVAALHGDTTIPIAEVLRKDVTATGSSWVDVTTEALDAASGDFEPWGTVGSMSEGDAFYLRTDGDFEPDKVYVEITIPGAGTWDLEIQEWDSAQDQWVAAAGLSDGSNAFRASAGVYVLSYTPANAGSVRLDDTQPAYRWRRVVLTNFVSATTAPVLSRVWFAADEVHYDDITASHTSEPPDWTSLPADELPTVGKSCILVHPGPPIGEDVTVYQPRSSNYAVVAV